MAAPDLADVAWEQLLTDAIRVPGLADRGDLVRTIASEMPVDVASSSVAQLLADRHALLAAVYQAFADALAGEEG